MFASSGGVVRPFVYIFAALIGLAACGKEEASAPAAAAGDPAALRTAVHDPRVTRFYESRQWRTAWTPEAEAALRAAIGGAGRHGLAGDDFLRPLARAGTPAARDAALSLAALSFAEALARGRTDPRRLQRVYTLPRPDPDLAAGLNRALAGNKLAGWLDGLAPQDAEYGALSAAYLETSRQIAAAKARPAPALVDRARALAVNLERRRWLERAPAATRIDVNTGAATLVYWRDGQAADSRRVVVGDSDHQTPSLASPLYRLAANPTWTVPRSIQEAEIAPKGAGYMRRNNMEWRDGRIVQESGPRNSLGLVKFDMLNDQAIYLHDTPAKSLFALPDRHSSHGCVRVDDALGFARLIAEDQGVLEQWDRARATNEESFVPLPRAIPVRLLYHTAFLNGGRIEIVPDAYGWDEDIAEALGLPARPRRAGQRRAGDLGP
jgi:murein L,D-transpeptidase YcbB/YkuD